MSMVVSAIAISPVLRGNAIKDSNTSEYTKNVMHAVPSILLRVLWYNNIPESAFPVDKEYLNKLMKSMGEDYSLTIRRNLGEVFSQVIATDKVVKLSAICSLLADNVCKESAIMRANIMTIYTRLYTSFAFMIPESLCIFISTITNIGIDGQIYMSSLEQSNLTGSINPGVVLNKMSSEWLSNRR
jgi:hypothetical protein